MIFLSKLYIDICFNSKAINIQSRGSLCLRSLCHYLSSQLLESFGTYRYPIPTLKYLSNKYKIQVCRILDYILGSQIYFAPQFIACSSASFSLSVGSFVSKFLYSSVQVQEQSKGRHKTQCTSDELRFEKLTNFLYPCIFLHINLSILVGPFLKLSSSIPVHP